MRPATTPPHLFTLVLCTAIAVLSLNMFLPSLARIGEEFKADYGLVNLSIAGYLSVTGVLQLLIGPLSDRYGRRPVLLVSMAIFMLASIGCALAQSIWVFLGFRLLQGGVISAQVISRSVLRDMYPPNEAASKLGYVSMVMSLAPMLGPMLGGGLDMVFGWRSAFVLYMLLGLVILVMIWVDLGETNNNRAATMTQQIREYPHLFRSRRFWGYSLCAAFSVGGFFSFITGTPLVAAAWFDMSPAQVGLGIGIITGGFMVGNFVTGRLSMRMQLVTMVIAGRVFATIGPLAGLLLFSLGLGNLWVYFGSAIVLGFGNGLTMANANAGLMSVRPHLAGSASGLSGALTVALGAVLTTVTGTIVTATNAPFAVLGLMLCCGVFGLASALFVRWVDLREPLPDAV